VLDAWKVKGGEPQDYELYIEAVDDVKVDISDTVTTWTTVVDWVGSLVEELAKRASGALFDIVIMVLLALAVWIAVTLAVKRRVGSSEDNTTAGSGEVGGAGATRVETLLPLFRKFISITLIAIVVMISLSSLGVDVAPLLAGAGMVGIAVGFGAQTLVRDVVSGLFFLLDDAFRMGEYVEIENIRGAVERISVRSLQLRHHNGPVHTIPFGEIRHLTNYSRDYAIMKFEIRLPFETDIEEVRKIIKAEGLEMMEDEVLGPMMLGPLKSQGVNRMDDSALIVRCKFTAKPGEQFVVQALAKAGIHFAPRRVIVETASSAAAESPQVVQAAAGSVDAPRPDAKSGGGAR
jgi:small-conductance mechanosensitive channel